MDSLQLDVAVVELLFGLRKYMHSFFSMEEGAAVPIRCMGCAASYQTMNYVHVGHSDGCSVGHILGLMERVKISGKDGE
jgi:hypothetical protein